MGHADAEHAGPRIHRTDENRHARTRQPGPDGADTIGEIGERRQSLTRTIPLARIGDPSEIAGTVAFLISPAAAYITGTVIRGDGGFGLSPSGLMSG